jgi:hypothetical protein
MKVFFLNTIMISKTLRVVANVQEMAGRQHTLDVRTIPFLKIYPKKPPNILLKFQGTPVKLIPITMIFYFPSMVLLRYNK